MPPIGQILLFPYDFAPRGLAFCNGTLVSVAQKFALPKLYAPDNYHYYIVLRGMSPSRP